VSKKPCEVCGKAPATHVAVWMPTYEDDKSTEITGASYLRVCEECSKMSLLDMLPAVRAAE